MNDVKLPKGLTYSSDTEPGCTRRRCGKGFAFYDVAGSLIRDPAAIARFKALAVPPAYSDVWLCPDPYGHLQATGRDDRGRKQYRYHPDYRNFRDALKFDRMVAFGHALPRIRRAVTRALRVYEPGDRRFAVALVVKLLDATGFRIGNESYLRENGSRGALTLVRRNVRIERQLDRMEFVFTAKGGQRVNREVQNRYLAQCVKDLQELPGQRLFVYRNELGNYCDLCSEDVNGFLERVGGSEFTAKDFRTWIGSREAVAAIGRSRALAGDGEGEVDINKLWREAVAAAAETLGNTEAVARDSYIHPELATPEAASYFFQARSVGGPSRFPGLKKEEEALLKYLEQTASVELGEAG